VGLAAGLAILFLIERIDDRLSSLGDVQKHFPEKVLGQIIHQSHNAAALELLRPDDARHSFAESFRAIRSAFVYLPDEKARPKSILITSAIPGEGKSTVSANLAIAFALSGAKTLLVDCDLRRGGQHRAFGLNNDAGLSEVLQDRVPWTEVVKPSGWNNLSVITRGGNLQQPAEHLLSPAADRFLKEAYKAYDYIIVDSAPVMVAEDTASLAPKIDAVGVVLRFSVSSARMSRRTIDRLKERRARVLGVILNEITVSMPEYGYYNYGGYYYDEAKT
jgi:capsular exopolysaccharide synthesis family protein